jgi:N-acetylmuramoyl-L-alanine amidase
MKGIRQYFYKYPPPGTRLAMTRHVISSGDTLSEIAARYKVSLDDLRSANNLKNDVLIIGQELVIPAGMDG